MPGLSAPVPDQGSQSAEPDAMTTAKAQEIERKWLVTELPPDLHSCKSIEMFAGYLSLAKDGNNEVRIRREGDEFVLTVKGDGSVSRDETPVRISAEQFAALRPAVLHTIDKVRYLVPVDGDTKHGYAEVDVYRGALEGADHIVVEVEFGSAAAAEAWTPPHWFGREVTLDKRFKNGSLAAKGWPED